MWNLALDGNGNPKLPGTNSCGTPCRPVVTVNSDGSWSVNQECECRASVHARPPADHSRDPLVLVPCPRSYTACRRREVYAMGQASKAIIPRDAGGPFGKRIGVSVGGSLNWALRVGAYVTGRRNSADWLRYSLVVLNWCVPFVALAPSFPPSFDPPFLPSSISVPLR